MSLVVRDVIYRAMRLNGSLAAGDTPAADELADALEAFNTLKASWFGTLIGGRLTAQNVSGSTAQAENGGAYAIPAVAFTLTAPSSPRSGARFAVLDAQLNFATDHCTINPNGRLIEGAVANLTLSTNGDNRRWWHRGDAGNWVREADWTDASDAIEFPDAVIAYMPYMLAVALAAEFNTQLRADIIAANTEGRAVLARHYAPRGRNIVEPSLGAAPQAQGQTAG